MYTLLFLRPAFEDILVVYVVNKKWGVKSFSRRAHTAAEFRNLKTLPGPTTAPPTLRMARYELAALQSPTARRRFSNPVTLLYQ